MCSTVKCWLHSRARKTHGWRSRRGVFFCPECYGKDHDRPPPLPFPKGGELNLLARRVVDLTEALNTCKNLPPWVEHATDAVLRYQGRPALADPEEPDAGNSGGSVLVLAMLLPEEFGVPSAPALTIFGDPPPHGLLKISTRRARSSVGSDNRRT